jgi:hypothetical protein
MRDLALYPVPLPTSENELDEEGLSYVATKLSLGAGPAGDISLISTTDTRICAQRVLRVLLTEKGTMPGYPQVGTNLVALSKYGFSPESINEDVVLILLDAEAQVKQLDSTNSGLSSKSKLSSIDLTDLQLIDKLKIVITVTTAGGQSSSIDLQV